MDKYYSSFLKFGIIDCFFLRSFSLRWLFISWMYRLLIKFLASLILSKIKLKWVTSAKALPTLSTRLLSFKNKVVSFRFAVRRDSAMAKPPFSFILLLLRSIFFRNWFYSKALAKAIAPWSPHTLWVDYKLSRPLLLLIPEAHLDDPSGPS